MRFASQSPADTRRLAAALDAYGKNPVGGELQETLPPNVPGKGAPQSRNDPVPVEHRHPLPAPATEHGRDRLQGSVPTIPNRHRVAGPNIMARWLPVYQKDGIDLDIVDAPNRTVTVGPDRTREVRVLITTREKLPAAASIPVKIVIIDQKTGDRTEASDHFIGP